MDAVLVAPPYIRNKDFSTSRFASAFLTPAFEHLGLESILANCLASDFDVTCMSCPIERLDVPTAGQELAALKPSAIGISINYENVDWVGGVQLARELRNRGYTGPLVAGGMGDTCLAEEILGERSFDAVVCGEGEWTFPQVLRSYQAQKALGEIRGLMLRTPDGARFTGPARPPTFDAIPSPRRALLHKLDRFQATIGIPVETSRGCWGRCSFCMVPEFHGHEWRPKPLVNVVQEMRAVQDALGPAQFEFVDDNFFGPHPGNERAFDLADLMQKEGLRSRIALSCRVDSIAPEWIRRLQDVGLNALFVGVESGSRSVLRRYAKGTTVDRNRKAIEILSRFDLPVNTCFIMFDPYTTLAELRESVNFVCETEAYRLGMRPLNLLNSLTVLKGTSYYELLRDSGLLIPIGKMFFDIKYTDPAVALVRAVMLYLNILISPIDMKVRHLVISFIGITRLLASRYHLTDGIIEGIPELHHDFFNGYSEWHNTLPGFVLSTLDSVLGIMESGMPCTEETLQTLKLAVVSRFHENLQAKIGKTNIHELLLTLDQLFSAPVIRLTIPGQGVLELDRTEA